MYFVFPNHICGLYISELIVFVGNEVEKKKKTTFFILASYLSCNFTQKMLF